MWNSVPFTKNEDNLNKTYNSAKKLWLINLGNVLWIYLKICCVHIVRFTVANLCWLNGWRLEGLTWQSPHHRRHIYGLSESFRLVVWKTSYRKASNLWFRWKCLGSVSKLPTFNNTMYPNDQYWFRCSSMWLLSTYSILSRNVFYTIMLITILCYTLL